MKLLKFCFFALILSIGFSACEVQGDVVNIESGTPSNADTVLPRKYKNYQKADSAREKKEEDLPAVYRR